MTDGYDVDLRIGRTGLPRGGREVDIDENALRHGHFDLRSLLHACARRPLKPIPPLE
jgi:hypothetical protein